MQTVDDFLEHFGVKGQKWGIRNKKRSNKLGPSKDSKRASSTLKKVKSGSVKSLTNQELRDFNNRVELEKKYKTINPGKVEKGHAAVKTVLATGATVNAAIVFAKSPAGQAIAKKLVNKK